MDVSPDPQLPKAPAVRSQHTLRLPSPFESLPDALLCDILLLVEDFSERRGLTRVCRRWRLLVDSPPLLRRVSVSLRAIGPDDAAEDSGSDGDGMYWWYNYWQDPERPIQHILRFFGWLKRQAAPHVEQLSISLGQLVINNEIENEETITSELCCVLHTCTRLRDLNLSLGSSLWLDIDEHVAPSAQAQLRTLAVMCMNRNDREPSAGLNISGLAALTALETLHLGGQPLLFSCPESGWIWLNQLPPVKPAEVDRLSPSLTSLTLDGYVDWSSIEEEEQFVPPQITALTGLRRLALGNVPCNSGADFRSLSALSSLTALHLLHSAHLPACLPQLPRLRALRLEDSPRGVARADGGGAAQAELCAMLRHFVEAAVDGQQLTHLVLEGTHQLPAEVSALPHLQALLWLGGSAATQLPSCGPYLTSLRRLALASWVAASNTARLIAMPKLEALAVFQPAGSYALNVATELGIMQWAAQQPQPGLRRLGVSFNNANFRPGSWAWS